MHIACLDLEGVLVPEIWINVAERTGVEALRATTRDIPDYDDLMRQRFRILEREKIDLPVIQSVINKMGPMEGALEFLDWLRERAQVVILSDTFYEFATPLMRQLGYPTLLCHHLLVDEAGRLTDYCLRVKDAKCHAVKAFQELNFQIIAVGDSYNDTAMLTQAEAGIFFCPPENIVAEFPQFPVTNNYLELKDTFLKAFSGQVTSAHYS